MFVLVRAVTYATLFIGLLLVFVPARILERSGMVRPAQLEAVEYSGIVVAVAGWALALWCILTFALIGRGTPAPFDPPRKLVIQGPYRYVRNPMYLGAALTLCGAALFYRSLALLAYMGVFLIATHIFVVWYEEPTLTRLFGADYEQYRTRVGRWLVRRPTDSPKRTTELRVEADGAATAESGYFRQLPGRDASYRYSGVCSRDGD
jgi:protein-S-isoprenylcysteine O-methyltransferase Ste14